MYTKDPPEKPPSKLDLLIIQEKLESHNPLYTRYKRHSRSAINKLKRRKYKIEKELGYDH